jgi:hypothetical protein
MIPARSLVLMMFLVLLIGCGKRGPVRPLIEKLPRGVTGAELTQRGNGFLLSWKMPTENQDGTRLDDLDVVEIRRLFVAPAEFCSECPAPWPLIARISPQLPAPARRIKQTYLFIDQGAAVGQVAHYRLTALDREGRASAPVELHQAWRTPDAAPELVRAVAGDRSVSLEWKASLVPEGATLLGYQLYRREAETEYSLLPMTIRPLEKPEFSDFGLVNGKVYTYRMTRLIEVDGDMFESLPSADIRVIPTAE